MITMSHNHNGDFNLGVPKLPPVRSVWHWLLKTRAGVEIIHTHINICSPAAYTLVVAKSCALYQKVNHTTGATRIMHHELRAYAPLLYGFASPVYVAILPSTILYACLQMCQYCTYRTWMCFLVLLLVLYYLKGTLPLTMPCPSVSNLLYNIATILLAMHFRSPKRKHS